MTDARTVILLAAIGLALAGCGSSALTTASLTGGGEPTAAAGSTGATATLPPSPPPSDPTSRAIQVGATSARASRCGFYFDPTKLRGNFLAAEAAQGAAPDQLQKIEREYDHIRGAVLKATTAEADYCNKSRANEIKTDLNRHLAGDFTPTPKKPEAQGGGLFSGLGDSTEQKPWQANKVWDDMQRRDNSR
jgi:hypothetical protein